VEEKEVLAANQLMAPGEMCNVDVFYIILFLPGRSV